MSKYSKYGKIAKCGSCDSKYMGRPSQFNKDIQSKIDDSNKFKQDLRELFINSPGRLEFKYAQAIEVFIELKEELNL